MTDTEFRALVVTEVEPGKFVRTIETRSTADLPAGDLLVRVHFSSLNYKDALSATGNRSVTRQYPHTPGVDAAGVVAASESGEFEVGDEVAVIGYDLGMNTSGGFGEFIKVPADWAVKLPATLTPRESMVYGMAGVTAAMCIDKIVTHGATPEDGEVLVTGATGGVGSFAVGMLAQLGYKVVAATGKVEEAEDYLRELGAESLMSRAELTENGGRPLLKRRWAAVVDSVGGDMLASALKATQQDAAVAICGLAASPDLPTTVLPFILRGLTLYGIDAVQVPIEERRRIWQLIAGDWKLLSLDKLAREVSLVEVDPEIERILEGGQTGRVLVALM